MTYRERRAMDDSKIIGLFERRDETAIAETARKYGSTLHLTALRILGIHEDAEECVNDTYLAAWNAIPPEKPLFLKQYLAKITRRLAFNRYKASTREKRGGGETAAVLDELSEVLADKNDVESVLHEKALAEAVNRFLHALPKRESAIFLRRYFYAEEMREIGKRFGMREPAVRMSLSRTREKLKEYLKKEDLWE